MSITFKGVRVLVTGAGGFIGSHLVERLLENKASVRAMVHYNALGTRGWLDTLSIRGQIDVFAGDITDRDSVRQAVEGIEVVFHLAALIGIPYSYYVPSHYLQVNAQGTLNLLLAAREAGVRRFVHASTSEVFGAAEHLPLNERSTQKVRSPYAASKIAADRMVEAFHASYGFPAVTVRPFNTYGPRQSARAIIPTIAVQCLSGLKELRLGNLTPTRDFTYVEDTVRGFISSAASNEAVGKVFHLGTGIETGIGSLAKRIADLCGTEIRIEEDIQRKRPVSSEVMRLAADSSAAREVLGWNPKHSLDSGLNKTVAWIRENLDRYRPESYAV